jgi:hypothetical protein
MAVKDTITETEVQRSSCKFAFHAINLTFRLKFLIAVYSHSSTIIKSQGFITTTSPFLIVLFLVSSIPSL